jgi:DNA-binding LytR/AlgR family response regulator
MMPNLISIQDFIFFKSGKEYLRINLPDILYVQAEKRYVTIVATQRKYLSLVSISYIEELLPKSLFCRVHRSFIISLRHTDKFDDELAYISNKKIPIAKQYRNILKDSTTTIPGKREIFNIDKDNIDKLLTDINL